MNRNKILLFGGIAIVGITIGIIAKNHLIVNKEGRSVAVVGGTDGPTSVFVAGKLGDNKNEDSYTSIKMSEAKEIFEKEGDYIIVDVRRPDEFAKGHIPNAINIPNETIDQEEPEQLPDKDQDIYVYCRSGNRSKQASQKLVEMGYTSIIEFGGILDWPGVTEKD